ncbi:MAG TPA: hypothetical protein VHX39_36820 [Acetobacteraceae bacterium]|jgi:hypothetical protein|nr:hypothetical protein [Acetobacteraceae bacterium]
MIDEPGHPTGYLVIPFEEETTMLKTISAALLAVSVLAAPAFAAGHATSHVTKTAPVIKAEQVKQTKSNVLNANARMGRHHVRHVHRHRAHHRHVGALKTHKFSKVSTRHITPAAKRG